MFIQLYGDFSVLGISASPNLCLLCNCPKGDAHEGVVSTGKSIDHEGALELCKNCVLEMASLFGAVTADKVDPLRTRNRQLGMQIAALLKGRDGLDAQIASLRDEVEVLRETLKTVKK